MRKHVYGKKTKQSAFTVSNIFAESSPTQTESRTSTQDDSTKDDILQASNALQSLNLREDDASDSLPKKRTRKPLSKRDGNSRPTSRHGVSDNFTKCTKAEESQPSVAENLSRHRIENTRDAGQIGTVSQTSSIYELCDPYVQPLVALTNEQKIPLTFDAWSEDLVQHFRISKIAEASYSEVYRLSLLDEHPTLTSADESVLKLIAIKPPKHESNKKKSRAQKEREQDMSSVEDIGSEVRLLKRMTEIPGFTNYRALHILQGRPSKPFVQAWKEWNKARRKGEKSEFPDPSRKTSYEESQYWAVVEMQDAGTDVERLIEDEAKREEEVNENGISINSIWASWDIFWQTVLAIAKGESEAKFEHRDLHLGNICVRRKDGEQLVTLTADASKRSLGFTNLETTIIDYTLSRADMSSMFQATLQSLQSSSSEASLRSVDSSSSLDISIAYNPLQKQPKIFEGDADADYQYEVYRYMRTIASSTAADEHEPWKSFHPMTNLLWLHFVLYKLCETLQWPSQTVKKPKDKKHKRALELEDILVQVDQLLDIERLLGDEECLLNSAAELVAVALEQEWLCHEDINS